MAIIARFVLLHITRVTAAGKGAAPAGCETARAAGRVVAIIANSGICRRLGTVQIPVALEQERFRRSVRALGDAPVDSGS